MLSILVVGAVAMTFGGRDVKLKRRKSQALLAYLSLCQGLSETRERLVGLLWSESEGAKAHSSLRQALREVRQVFSEVGFPGFATQKLSVALEKRALDVDLWTVIREAEAFRAHPLLLTVQRLTDKVLDGLEDIDPSFRIWLLAFRQMLQDRLLRALESGMTSEAVDKATRTRLAEAIANLEPTNEIACRALMQARAEAGDTAGALRIYKEMWDLLDEDYDMEPSEQTQKLVADIKTGRFDMASAATGDAGARLRRETKAKTLPLVTQAPRAAAAPSPAKLELAVDAFNVQGVNPDKLHFVQGFHQSLISNLVRFREWYVTDRANQAQGSVAEIPAIGRYSLRAIAHESGNALNLVLTLIEESRNIYIWSDEFELGLDNWFSKQQQIVRRIATSLNVHVSAERLKRLAGDPDVSLDIHDQWLRAQSMVWSFSPEGWIRAAQLSREIIRLAPDFSPGLRYPGADRQCRAHRPSGRLPRSRESPPNTRSRYDRGASRSARYPRAPLSWLGMRASQSIRASANPYGTCERAERERSLDIDRDGAVPRLLRSIRAGTSPGRPRARHDLVAEPHPLGL